MISFDSSSLALSGFGGGRVEEVRVQKRRRVEIVPVRDEGACGC